MCDLTALTSNRSWPSNVHRSCRLLCCRPSSWSNAFRALESQLHPGENAMGTEDATNQQVKPSSKSSISNSPMSLPPPLPCKSISGWTGAMQSWPPSKMQFVEGSSSLDSHKIICQHRMGQCIDFADFPYLSFSPCRAFWGRWQRPLH
jgi:hypothetical protein